MPGDSETKKPETFVITKFQPVSTPETKVLVSTETKIDVEREIADQVRRIQRYLYKINNGIGRTNTSESNIRDALRIIKQLLEEGDVSRELQQKIEFYKSKLEKIIS